MEEFLDWSTLLTYGGCVAGTILVTEWLKKIFTKLPVQFISFAIAAVILVCGHIATATFQWAECFLYLVNAVAVSLASNGGFDILKRAFGVDKTGGDYDEMVINSADDENCVYLNLSKEPDEFEDGETVRLKVVKVQNKE